MASTAGAEENARSIPIGYAWLPTDRLSPLVRSLILITASVALATLNAFGTQASYVVAAVLGIPALVLNLVVLMRSGTDPERTVYQASEAILEPDGLHLNSRTLSWSELTRTFEFEEGIVLEWEQALRRHRILVENPEGTRGVSERSYEGIKQRAGINRARRARSARVR